MIQDNPKLVNSKTRHESTPLHLAAAYGHSEFVTALLQAGADVNATDQEFIFFHQTVYSVPAHRNTVGISCKPIRVDSPIMGAQT